MANKEPNSIDAPEEDYLYISQSQIINAGKGLFTAIKIYKDEVIAIFKGEIIPTPIVKNREAKGEDKYFMILPNGTVLDCMHTPCFAKFANDASGFFKSNFKNNAKITLDENKNVCLVATSIIKEGQEVFCSYGHKYWKKYQ